MNSKYCQYLYKILKKSVVEIGGLDVYFEIHISNIERNTNENVWLDWKFRTRDPCITSKVVYH